jgi:hypothetical protein
VDEKVVVEDIKDCVLAVEDGDVAVKACVPTVEDGTVEVKLATVYGEEVAAIFKMWIQSLMLM